MTEKSASQTQQMNDTWTKLVGEQAERVSSMVEEMGRLETKGMEQARAAFDEANKLFKGALEYQAQLAGEWRKLALEATRRATDLMTPRA